jgi:hypothetical protein
VDSFADPPAVGADTDEHSPGNAPGVLGVGLREWPLCGPSHADEEHNEGPERSAGQEYDDAENGNDGKRGNHRATSATCLLSRVPGCIFVMPLLHREYDPITMQDQCNFSA